MVFQSFALFPWLTVQQNVELGLEARGIGREERAERAEKAISLIGLSGFEGALPRELSGGMRQRVGIARALVTQPDVLLMDEAFSALDVLTGERLRDDILELWTQGGMPTKAMLVVSHNIEEAVLMADRILIFASDPGRVRFQLADRPAAPARRRFGRRALADRRGLRADDRRRAAAPAAPPRSPRRCSSDDRLPDADIARMEGLLELLAGAAVPRRGRPAQAGRGIGAHRRRTAAGGAAPSTCWAWRASQSGDLHLTLLGRRYVDGDHAVRQELFGQQVLENVPLAAHIRHSLEQDPERALPEQPFLRLLQQHLDAGRGRARAARPSSNGAATARSSSTTSTPAASTCPTTSRTRRRRATRSSSDAARRGATFQPARGRLVRPRCFCACGFPRLPTIRAAADTFHDNKKRP